MLRLSTLSLAQQSVMLDFLAQTTSTETYQHDGVILETIVPRSLFEDLKHADVREAMRAIQERDQNGAVKSPIEAETKTVDPSLVKSAIWIHRMMDDILQFRYKKFCQDTSLPSPPIVDDLSTYTFQFVSERYGVDNLIRATCHEFLSTIKAFRNYDLEVQIFGVLLSSAAYDTKDVKFFVTSRLALLPYSVLRRKDFPEFANTQGDLNGPRRYIQCKHIPALLRKALAAAKAPPGVLRRVRWATVTWCNSSGCFPGVVADPDFYCPPFMVDHPYVATKAPTDEMGLKHVEPDEQRFSDYGQGRLIVELGQLLAFLLLNFKQERLTPLPDTVLHQQRRAELRAITPSRQKSWLRRRAEDVPQDTQLNLMRRVSSLSPHLRGMSQTDFLMTPTTRPRSGTITLPRMLPVDVKPEDLADLQRALQDDASAMVPIPKVVPPASPNSPMSFRTRKESLYMPPALKLVSPPRAFEKKESLGDISKVPDPNEIEQKLNGILKNLRHPSSRALSPKHIDFQDRL